VYVFHPDAMRRLVLPSCTNRLDVSCLQASQFHSLDEVQSNPGKESPDFMRAS
jgi:hypothetical protein